MSNPDSLPTQPQIQRASEVERLPFSPTSHFRVVNEGGPGHPDIYEENSGRGDGPPVHRHPWPSWEIVIEGQVDVVIDGETFQLSAGDSIYVPPNAVHSYIVTSATARTIGVNLSDGRFPQLQRQAVEILAATPPDMGKLVAMAATCGVEVLGPPMAAGR